MQRSNESRGSEWRKWDLHLHCPGTKLNDQFEVPGGDKSDAYCKVLNDSEVQAFGITDYFSLDGYFRCVAEFTKRYPSSKKVFFPNVELRTSDVVNREQEEVNLHIIFNPSISDWEKHARELY